MCQTVAVSAESRFGPQYWPGLECIRFLSFVSAITLSISLKDSPRYAMISALDLAGFGPPRSHLAGVFSPDICFAQASLPHATCFTCSAKERTFLNSPWVGLKLHLSSGMASARVVKSCSMSFQMKLIESGIFLISSGRFCACAAAEHTNRTVIKVCKRYVMVPPDLHR